MGSMAGDGKPGHGEALPRSHSRLPSFETLHAVHLGRQFKSLQSWEQELGKFFLS